eukprot:4348031-Amphidinium_carterae.1
MAQGSAAASDREPEVRRVVKATNLLTAPFEVGPDRKVVEHESFAQCLDCSGQVGFHTGGGKFNYHYPKGQDCRPLRKTALALRRTQMRALAEHSPFAMKNTNIFYRVF